MAKKASLATARVVPVILAFIVAYVSYVVVGPLSINYLINGPRVRIAAGIALPIIWFFLLLPVAATYLRLLLVVSRNPGYTELGDADGTAARKEPPPEFWMRDVFACDQRGLPVWCQYCRNWKPDRAHHSQDAGRCTLKMDHFCPWVGGVVGERSVNFFLQFLFYATLLAAYGTALLGYFVHESRADVQINVALGLAGFFLLFTLGMVVNSFFLVSRNTTTIENIDNRGRTMLLAVLLPPELQPTQYPSSAGLILPASASLNGPYDAGSDNGPPRTGEHPVTSEIDDPSHSSYFTNNSGTNWALRRASRSEFWRGTVTYPLSPAEGRPLRTFAILETPPGMNPWDLGSPWCNMKNIMGSKLHHWLLPLRHSPCCDHSSNVSFYPLGPQFEAFLDSAGLVQRPSRRYDPGSLVTSSRRSATRKRRLGEGWQNGERPDGWVSEKAARRVLRQTHRRDAM
ncbi:hypothetical protein BAUCODRAFT_124601 [Baudoinia panamericana UAMH 10762]|uniref:Palmitoyltransferase n=1 Tax=Baudoinia panamericana (strain UAMH 10762) TaxID=717646 RepID=M2MBG2_BAUPA|nr:uncharacterized protein BAUCODRAFT_124601 [Baudoinia panamericana UAMH 10762]EMC93846.1 hypothetical protein BAUCODRAFT_124601 [Baudoinia panamericana UAMH 10762]